MTASQTYPRSRVRTPGFQSGSCPPRGATSVSRGSGNSVGSKGAKDTAPSRGGRADPSRGLRVNQRTEVAAARPAARQHRLLLCPVPRLGFQGSGPGGRVGPALSL